MSEIVNVKVVVYENGEPVKTLRVGYFGGQPYSVLIDTPDGVDLRYDGVCPKIDAVPPMGSAV